MWELTGPSYRSCIALAIAGAIDRRGCHMIQRGWEPVQVVCYAGYRGEQEPLRFTQRGRRFEIAEVVDRWLDPGHRYFKVRTGAGETLLLRHDEHSGVWTRSP
jgi:hypothetical protein